MQDKKRPYPKTINSLCTSIVHNLEGGIMDNILPKNIARQLDVIASQFIYTNVPPKIVSDLKNTSTDLKELSINGKTKNLQFLEHFCSLEKVWFSDVNQKTFDIVMSKLKTPWLTIDKIRAENMATIQDHTDLEYLSIRWNTKITRLPKFGLLKKLKLLSIDDFSKIDDLSPLTDCITLEYLVISGGIWSPLKIKTLAPLANLINLKYLTLCNIHVTDGSLKPLANLIQLKELSLSNQFTTEEYARLSIYLPNTHSVSFAPYYRINDNGAMSGKNIMVNGKGKPFLNSEKDIEKLKSYEKEFYDLKNKYKKMELGASDRQPGGGEESV